VYEDGVLKHSGGASGGFLSATGHTGLFQWSLTTLGAPLVQAPAMGTQTTEVSAPNLAGAHSIRIEVSQTGLPSASATGGGLLAQLANSFTANFLINGGAIGAVTIANYVDADNIAFGLSQLMASASFTSSGPNAAGTFLADVSLPNALFSETMVFEAVFLGGAAALFASAQITVPEPASLALLGAGLLGFGVAWRGRRRG
jgi:hypothetical protein